MDYKRIGRRPGLSGLLIYAAIAVICMLSTCCQKIFIVGDDTEYSSPEIKRDSLTFRLIITDGVVDTNGTLKVMPHVSIEIIKGEDLLYDAYYNVDEGEYMSIIGKRRDEMFELDCSEGLKPGSHRVSGQVTNTFVRKTFVATYNIGVDLTIRKKAQDPEKGLRTGRLD